ncbi:SDR family NAD(P)-dependent oxidoreductase [Novosphingobium sp. SL115]|uniref:SDR family NAD(P)-dependent oxidoreductase n=1 Tax=Novosphingobium sp. SL115 TaxID=2995150 RepID=UPI00227411D2|nr:SDR family NAD(P)-dependent oxidoreductase [Novosphingobium sp. SL115]MCY1670976.1 SDR family NAD(P)-dependent oxidoreductase [Novosphingobium sp. SL115]
MLIVGASGELGGALACHYAGLGASLTLWGRDAARLDRISRACTDAGARTTDTASVDLNDTRLMLDRATAADTATPFDLLVIASGRGDIRDAGARCENALTVAEMVQVNFAGPAALATALGERMAARGKGQIVLIGSAAAFHALPFATAYAGSKAGLARFAEGLRINLKRHGVSVTLVSPGFINTQAARNVPGPKPLALSAQRAAALIARATARGTSHVIMPWPFALLRVVDRMLPRPVRERLLQALAPEGR